MASATSRRSPVQHDDAGDSGLAQQTQRPGGVRADLVGEKNGAEHRAVRRHKGACRALIAHAAQEAPAPFGGCRPRDHIGVTSDRDAAPLDCAGHTRAGFFLHRGRQGQNEAACLGGGDHGLGDAVL